MKKKLYKISHISGEQSTNETVKGTEISNDYNDRILIYDGKELIAVVPVEYLIIIEDEK